MNNMDEHDNFHVAVKGLHFDSEGKLLFMKADETLKNEWDLPGGRIHHGEVFDTALMRECEEELGVKCKLLKKQPDYVWMGKNSKGYWRINLCFPVEFASLDFKASDENVEHGWFTLEEARKLKLSPHLNDLREIF